MDQVVRFNPALNPGFPKGRPIDGVAGTDFNIIINLNNAKLRNFMVTSAIRNKSVSVTADDGSRMNRHAVPDPAGIHDGHIGVDDDVVANNHIVTDENTVLNDRISRWSRDRQWLQTHR
jgi:hypothetical protein